MLALTAPWGPSPGRERFGKALPGSAASLFARRLTCVNPGIGVQVENEPAE